MDKIIIELKEIGCDTDTALKRVAEDKNFYINLIHETIYDPLIYSLGEHIENNNIQQSFQDAHTLKGLTGNLGITPMYTELEEMVKALRSNNIDNAKINYAKLMDAYEIIKKVISQVN